MFDLDLQAGIATVVMNNPPVNATSDAWAATANPGTAGFDAEIEQTSALLQSAVTRRLVGDFLARSNR